MTLKITIPLINGAKIEVDGDFEEVKKTVEHVDEIFDVMKTAIGEQEPVTIGNQLVQTNLQPQGIDHMPTLAKSGSFLQTLSHLMSSSWGEHPRTLPEIEEVLRTNGEYRSKSTVAASLLDLVKKGKLRRVRDGKKGLWKYVSG
jgi:hypothetical protein